MRGRVDVGRFGVELRACCLGIVLAAAACGEGDRALVRYAFFEEPSFSRDLLVLEFSDGNRARRVTGAELVGGTAGRWETPEFETRTAGELVTSFWLVEGADTLSSGTVRIELRPDFRWGVDFRRADEDPTLQCFGCAGGAGWELPASLRETAADSLWVVWGGNRISDPVVY